MNQVIEALKAGDQKTAFELLRRHLATHPKDANAWLWMSEATTDPKQQRDALNRVLTLAPDHPRADSLRKRLATLNATLGVSAPPSVVPPVAAAPTPPPAPATPPPPVAEVRPIFADPAPATGGGLLDLDDLLAEDNAPAAPTPPPMPAPPPPPRPEILAEVPVPPLRDVQEANKLALLEDDDAFLDALLTAPQPPAASVPSAPLPPPLTPPMPPSVAPAPLAGEALPPRPTPQPERPPPVAERPVRPRTEAPPPPGLPMWVWLVMALSLIVVVGFLFALLNMTGTL